MVRDMREQFRELLIDSGLVQKDNRRHQVIRVAFSNKAMATILVSKNGVL